MNDLITFENPEFGDIRTISLEDEPWFVGKDVAAALGYSDTKHAILDHVDIEDRINSKTQGQNAPEFGQRGEWLINESGLYALIFGSKLPGAKQFKRWVTSEVLPAIRRTGSYTPQGGRLPASNSALVFEPQDKSRIRRNWFSFMLTALERGLGLSQENMLHQAYDGMKSEGLDLEMLKQRYIEATGRLDCSTFEVVLNDRGAALELADILCQNMKITFIKRCM